MNHRRSNKGNVVTIHATYKERKCSTYSSRRNRAWKNKERKAAIYSEDFGIVTSFRATIGKRTAAGTHGRTEALRADGWAEGRTHGGRDGRQLYDGWQGDLW